jgi:hypothetical protein
MTRERLNELWPVMEHFKNGGEVEFEQSPNWWTITANPEFSRDINYRIAQPKPMTFMEAVEAMKQGKKVRRRGWFDSCSRILDEGDFWLVRKSGERSVAPIDMVEVEATDWEVVE